MNFHPPIAEISVRLLAWAKHVGVTSGMRGGLLTIRLPIVSDLATPVAMRTVGAR